jgi:hypothetical protein
VQWDTVQKQRFTGKSGAQTASYRTYPAIHLTLSGVFGPGIQSVLGCGPGGIDAARPSVRHGHQPPDLAGGPWLTIADAAFRLGITTAHLRWWIREVRIKNTVAGTYQGRRWRLLDEAEIDALASDGCGTSSLGSERDRRHELAAFVDSR